MTKPLIRCAIYTRKSSEEGLEQEYNSLDAQRDACRSYIESQKTEGWVLYQGRFDDGGISGGTMERPGLKKLLALIEAGEINVIVVYKIDRLTRSLPDFARIVEVLDKHKASFVSVTQQFNTTTSMGRLTLNVLLSFAQFEREVTSERIKDKIAASKRKGLWMGGFPPLGYDINNRRLVPNPNEIGVVEKIFKLSLECRSLTKLETSLTKEGVLSKSWRTQNGTTRKGQPLTRTKLHRMLRNPVYVGKIRHGDRILDGEQDSVLRQELWERVQAMLDEGAVARTKNVNEKNDALLRGLVFDDRGNKMVPSYVKKKNRIAYRYYISAPLIRGDKDKAGTIGRVSAQWLEQKIVDTVSAHCAVPIERTALAVKENLKKVTLYRDEIVLVICDNARNEQIVQIPAKLEKPKGGRRIFHRGGKNNQNEGLTKAVAQAHGWRKELEAGAHKSVLEIAKSKALSERYVWKILRLAYLAPDIVESILDGRQPPGLTIRRINQTGLSPCWSSQRHALGIDAAR